MKKWTKLLACVMVILTIVSVAFAEEAAEKPSIVAHKANGITIDGSLDDWNLDSPAVVKDVTQVIRDAVLWKGEDDLSANFYLAWDETNLYIAAEVHEDTPFGAIEMLPIDGMDNIKLYISTNPASDPARTQYDTNDFLVYFIMNQDYWDTAIDRTMVPKDNRQRFVSVGIDGGENVLDGYVCAAQTTTYGFTWEAIVPWACFSNNKIAVYTPAVGDVLACDFAITDIDYPCPGTEYIPQMAWTGTLKINENPSLWGSVTIAE